MRRRRADEGLTPLEAIRRRYRERRIANGWPLPEEMRVLHLTNGKALDLTTGELLADEDPTPRTDRKARPWQK